MAVAAPTPANTGPIFIPDFFVCSTAGGVFIVIGSVSIELGSSGSKIIGSSEFAISGISI